MAEQVGPETPDPQPKSPRWWVRHKKAVVLAAVVVAGGGTFIGDACLCSTPGGQSPSPAGTLANVWIDANGGTCVDNASEAAYADASACGSWNAAYLAADPGDTVRVAAGATITGGTIAVDANKAGLTTDVLFFMPTDGLVSGTLVVEAHDITFTEFTWAGQTTAAGDTDENAQFHVYGDNISFISPDSSSFQVFDGDNILIDGGDIGPCYSDVANPLCTPRIKGSSEAAKPSNVTISDTVIHDQTADSAAGACGEPTGCHTDGLAIFGSGTGVLLERNTFYNNQITNIRAQNCCSVTNDGLTIRNNMFGNAFTNAALTSWSGATLNIDTAVPGLYVGFNSFAYKTSCGTGVGCSPFIDCVSGCGTAGSPASMVGNLVGMTSTGTCGSNVSWTYNVFRQWSDGSTSTPCAGTGNTLSAYNSSLPPYTTLPALGASGAIDFHITGAAWDGDGQVTVGCLSTDFDGEARSSTCDAGMDER